jgi:hypothetical protein
MSVSAPSIHVTLRTFASRAAWRACSSMSGSTSRPIAADPPGHRQCQLASSTAKIHYHVPAAHPEGARQDVHDSARVSAPVAVVETRCLAAEVTPHAVMFAPGKQLDISSANGESRARAPSPGQS